MANLIAGLIVVVLLAAAITYIVKAKKKGVKCIGCPAAGECAHKNDVHESQGCGCGCSGCGTDI